MRRFFRDVGVLGVCVTFCVASAGGSVAAPSAGTPSSVAPDVSPDVVAASSAPGSRWQPEPAEYGTASHEDVPVTMSDGTVLRVNIIYPTDPRTGQEAAGTFPVLLTQTPYGKGRGGSSSPGSASNPGGSSPTGGPDNYLAQRGYIEVVADVRGTGDSGGSWGLFDPVQTRDGMQLVNWAARLPHSSGSVGTYGPSYLGINQLLLAGAVGKQSPLKAIFPVVAANDAYRDTSFMGGILDNEFDTAYLGLTGAGNTANPVGDAAGTPPTTPSDIGTTAAVEAQHAGGLASYHASSTAEIESGGPQAYDGQYWQDRAPNNVLDKIVANGIPAYLIGGEFDLFQRGEPLNYAALQNAWAGRPVNAPMQPGQPVTGRYQLINGPWEHLNGASVNADPLMLEWFDTWLKGEHTGMADTPTPLHYYDLGTNHYTETTTYPFTGAQPTRLYFGPGTLSPAPPRSAASDRLVWTGAGSPCNRPTDQWSMGAISVPAQSAGAPQTPCADDDRTTQARSTSSTYTTAPFRAARTLAGPIAATVYATANTTDTQWVAEVEDVAPDGVSRPLTEGALLGSFRGLDRRNSWTTTDGNYLLPYHPYTKTSSQPVTPGQLTRYDIEIFPTYATIAPGHSLRVTLSTADTPHLLPVPPQLSHLTGGTYQVARSPQAPSGIEVPLIPAS